MLDTTKYNKKPQGYEVGKITNSLNETEIEIHELANKLVEGCTFRPSFLNGNKETNWLQQQLFALDFDDGTTIEEELKKCEELKVYPCFGYTSFSHKEHHHKFRLVFCTDEVIYDYEIAKKFQLVLMNIFSNCDKKCTNLNRLYFGGKKLIYEKYHKVHYQDIFKSFSTNLKENTTFLNNQVDNAKKCPPNNNKIYNNSYIIRGTKSPLNTLGVNNNILKEYKEEKSYNIKAIAQRDVEYLKKKINHPHMLFNNNQEFCDYIFKEINLGELLEFKYPKSIKCIFHNDTNNSASIFRNEEGYWIYHCFSCGVSYNLLGVIEVLGKFKSRPKAYAFIREIFNLEMQETEWQKEQKAILLENIKSINNGEFERNCPQTYKNIKSNIKYLFQMLIIAMDNVYNENLTDNENNVLFYASNKFICREMGINEGSSKEISKKVALLAYHNLINKVDDSEVNEDMIKRSKAININSDGKNKKYRHINYYSIPSYNNMLYSSIEEKGKKWKENNYTMKGLSREMFFRTEGAKVADKLYPQYKKIVENKIVKERTTSYLSNKRTLLIVKILFDIFEIKGYITEKEIIYELVASKEIEITKSEAERQLKKSLQEILLSYNFQRIRSNKEIKELYGVAESGYPFIIVKK
jgi:hypothetical protein